MPLPHNVPAKVECWFMSGAHMPVFTPSNLNNWLSVYSIPCEWMYYIHTCVWMQRMWHCKWTINYCGYSSSPAATDVYMWYNPSPCQLCCGTQTHDLYGTLKLDWFVFTYSYSHNWCETNSFIRMAWLGGPKHWGLNLAVCAFVIEQARIGLQACMHASV